MNWRGGFLTLALMWGGLAVVAGLIWMIVNAPTHPIIVIGIVAAFLSIVAFVIGSRE